MKDFYSLPNFLEAAQSQGLDISERTLNYYITRGLLPKPTKSPFVGADGRVAYLPGDALRQLRKILRYKEQGLKLEQIRKALEARSLPQELAVEPKDSWQREVIYRFLRHLPAGFHPSARLQLRTRLHTQQQKLSVDDLRTYQCETLAHLVGEVEAQRWVQQFYLELPPKELEKHLHHLHRELGRSQEEAGAATIFQRIRSTVSEHTLKRVDTDEYQRYLKNLCAQFENLHIESESGRPWHWAATGKSRCLEALQELLTGQPGAAQSLKRLQAGLEMLSLARQMAQMEVQAQSWLDLDSATRS